MVSVNISLIHGDQFINTPKPIPATTIANIPDKISKIKNIRLTQQLAKAVFIINNKTLINAQSGQKIEVTVDYIKQRAIESFSHNAAIVHIEKLSQYPEELGGRNSPIWRVDFDSTFNPSLYFSPNTARLISKRSDLWRVYDFLWSLHIMDYEDGEDSHNLLLLIAISIALLMITLGLWLLFYAIKLPIPVGKLGILQGIHRWLALVASIQLLLWVISGLAFNLMSHDKIKSTLKINNTSTLSFSPQSIDFKNILKKYPTAISININATKGAPLVYINNGEKLQPLTLSLNNKVLTEQEIKTIVKDVVAPVLPIKSLTLVKPDYIESRKFKRLLWQVQFDNKNNSALYIDAYTGRALTIIEDGWRIKDFLWMLHIMDYQFRNDFNNPLIIIVAALATIACLAGFILLILTCRLSRKNNSSNTINIVVVNTETNNICLSVKTKQLLLEALTDNDIAIPSGCGGKGTCAQCKVMINDQQPLNDQEKLTLSDKELAQGYRLACQTMLKKDVTITIPDNNILPSN